MVTRIMNPETGGSSEIVLGRPCGAEFAPPPPQNLHNEAERSPNVL